VRFDADDARKLMFDQLERRSASPDVTMLQAVPAVGSSK